MTGRELIIYILANGLEDEQINVDINCLKFLTVDEAAIKFEVGNATIKAWYDLGVLEGFKIDDVLYISPKTKCLAWLKAK